MRIKTLKMQLAEGYSTLKHLFLFEENAGSTSLTDIVTGGTLDISTGSIANNLPDRSVNVPDDTALVGATFAQPGSSSFMLVAALDPISTGITLGQRNSNLRIQLQSFLEMGVVDGSNSYTCGALTVGTFEAVVMICDRANKTLSGYTGTNTTPLGTADITSMAASIAQDNAISINAFGSAIPINGFGMFVFSGDVPSDALSAGQAMANGWKNGNRFIDGRCKDWK